MPLRNLAQDCAAAGLALFWSDIAFDYMVKPAMNFMLANLCLSHLALIS
jgi:hypothetical protein